MKKYPTTPEIVLGNVQVEVPEIKVRMNRSTRKKVPHGTITSGATAAEMVRSIFRRGEIELQEQMIVLYLSQSNTVLGYYRHSLGGINSTIADIRVILGTALKCAAVKIILAHNHPSGNLMPSAADKTLTANIKEAARFMDITVLDHVIVTKTAYTSFADEGLLGLEGIKAGLTGKPIAQFPGWEFVDAVKAAMRRGEKHNKTSMEKLAASYRIADKNLVKELIELAIVRQARAIAQGSGNTAEKYERIVELYNSQVNLSHRTSQSILLQQYSTPAPIGYLAGVFCGLDTLHTRDGFAFEPSAGNGLLTIAAKPERCYVNELDAVRYRHLRTQGFADVHQLDATKPFKHAEENYDAVITNPPFGKLDKPVMYETFKIDTLDHLMALRVLDTMKDDGKAAIIIGGHTTWDDKGRIQAGKNRIFFNYLYSRYHVADVINIDGHKLYSRQGTAFDVRLILIEGRKAKPEGAAPLFDKRHDKVVMTFDDLYDRVMMHVQDGASKGWFDLVAERRDTDVQYSVHRDTRNGEHVIETYLQVIGGLRHTVVRQKAQPTEKEIYEVAESGHFSARPYRLGQACDGSINTPVLALFGDYCTRNGLVPWQVLNEAYPAEPPVDKAWFDEVKADADWEEVAYPKDWNDKDFKGLIESLTNINYRTLADVITNKRSNRSSRNSYSELEKEALALQRALGLEGLGAPYEPASDACTVLNTQVPDSMAFETTEALKLIEAEVGGDIDNFVRHRLGYPTKAALCKALSAEQIDAVAMAIYNIEARGQGMIIGDQTGIGKGRVAAAVIRYATQQGLKPVFLTEKANLFSDIYRDLLAISSGHLKPFIVNGRESKTDIKDEDGNVIYQAPAVSEQQAIFQSRELPAKYDFVVATYSQFNSPEKKPEKPAFLNAIAKDNIFIMDEAHNSSGSSNTGEFLQGVVSGTRGVVFLSATFAKRPDNMPIYAMKTAIADCNMSKDDLVAAITRGGVALQEVLSSQLVAEGQMLRRERSFEGVEVNYLTLDDKAEEHRAIADNITLILRDIINFQKKSVTPVVEQMDEIAAAEGKEMDLRQGTSQAGVDNQPYFSKVFQVINQMLFSLKAEAVAERAIMRLKEGKKPVIAFASTMGSFIETLENEKGMAVGDGDTINADFAEVLRRGLEGVMRYTEKGVDGTPVYKKFELSELSPEAQAEHARISEQIRNVATGITISPIDVVIAKIKAAGYSVAEVTGRKYELQLNWKGSKALVMQRRRINTNDAFRQFNNNEVDVLMINQSGSTGASAHAIPTFKVPVGSVQQRVMIVLQAELDINTEVQKRGRINRTGQILKPIYDYVTSAIPAEKRLMMMLQKKLKSLDANTASNQKQSSKILDVPDFLNKYGDKVVKEYLGENPEINDLLDDPLKMKKSSADAGGEEEESATENAAHKVSGRVAVLSTQMQQEFYNEISERYSDFVEYVKQIGEYDLEVEAMNLEAETINTKIVKMGKGSESAFGEDSVLETVRANVLKKPFTRTELDNLLTESLKGGDALAMQQELLTEYAADVAARVGSEEAEIHTKYDELIRNIPLEKKIKKLEGTAEHAHAVAERKAELQDACNGAVYQLHNKSKNRKAYLDKILRYFFIGRSLFYPIETFAGGNELVPAVFIGYQIERKKKNPYAPSAIKLRFAIANSSKYLAIPASYSEDIMAIMGASTDVEEKSREPLLREWESYTSQNNMDRKVRHIITGNLFQAFSDFKGKLVSYTTLDKKVEKGILMPENWDVGKEVQDKVVVPILKALPLIKSLRPGSNMTTNNGIGFIRQGSYFRIIVPGSRQRGGDVYLDEVLLELVEGRNFQKVSDKMVAQLYEGAIEPFVRRLQERHGCSVTINSYQLKDLADTRYSNRKKIVLPPAHEEPSNIISLLELEAEALALELDLLAA